MEVAATLGYRPNALAQGLISGRTNLVAVLISSLTNLYYPEVLDQLSHRLTAANFRVLLFSLSTESEVDTILDQVWRHSVDGVISAARLSDSQIKLFENHEIPLVLYNRTAAATYAASVCCDSVAGIRQLVGGLLAAGHGRFGIIAGPQDSFVGEERRNAAAARLAEAGITDVPLVRGDYSYESGGEGLRRLAAEHGQLDAVVCVNDLMAIGAIDAARTSLGLALPEDMSIVGFDGTAAARWQSYQVTSIRQPVRRMTQAAITMLVERIEDRTISAERRFFDGVPIAGNSARLG